MTQCEFGCYSLAARRCNTQPPINARTRSARGRKSKTPKLLGTLATDVSRKKTSPSANWRVALSSLDEVSTPGRIRTFNPRFRRPMRYPIAPRTHNYRTSLRRQVASQSTHSRNFRLELKGDNIPKRRTLSAIPTRILELNAAVDPPSSGPKSRKYFSAQV